MFDGTKELLEHEERVRCAKLNMPGDENLAEMAERFKLMGDPIRLKILFALSCGELCVEHLTQAVGGNQSAVSHKLRELKEHNIISCKRCGKQNIYSIADGHILTILSVAKEHLNCNE